MLINPKFSRARMTVGSWGAVPDRTDGGLSDASFQKTLQIMRQDGHTDFRLEGGAYRISDNLEFDFDGVNFYCTDGWATIYQTTYGKNVARFSGKGRPTARRLDLRNPHTGDAKTRITNGNIAQRYLGEFRRQEASALVIQSPDILIEDVITRDFIAGLRWIGGEYRFYEAAAFGGSATTLTAKLNDSMGLDENGDPRPDGFYIGARFLMRGTSGGSWASVVLVTGYDSATNTITWAVPQTVPSGTIWLYLVMGQVDGGVVNNHRSYNEDFGRIYSYVKDIEFAGMQFTSGITKTQGAPPHAMYGTGSVDGVDDTIDAEADLTPDMPAAENVYVTGSLLTVNSPEHMAYKVRNARSVTLFNEAVSEGSRGCFYVEMVERASGRSRMVNAKTTSGSNRPSAFEFYDCKYVDWKADLTIASDYAWAGTTASLPAVVVGNPIGRGRTPVTVNLEISGVFRGDATAQYGILLANTSGFPNVGKVNLRKADLRAENPTPITLFRLFDVDTAMIGPDIDMKNVDASTGATLSVQGRGTFDVGCVAGLLDYDSRRTGGRLLITDEGLALATTYNLVRDRATEGTNNLLSNPMFDWPSGSPAALSTNVVASVATGWKAWRGAGGATVSKQAGFSGTESCMRVQRDSGNASTQSLFVGYELSTSQVRQFEGKEVTFAFAVRRGADLSTSLAQIRTFFRTGTAIGETIRSGDSNVGTYATGAAQTSNVNVTLDPTGRFYTVRHTLPAGIGSACLCIQMAPVGTAGAADYFEISPAALIAGASAKPFSALA